jgi:hypothetical protein
MGMDLVVRLAVVPGGVKEESGGGGGGGVVKANKGMILRKSVDLH